MIDTDYSLSHSVFLSVSVSSRQGNMMRRSIGKDTSVGHILFPLLSPNWQPVHLVQTTSFSAPSKSSLHASLEDSVSVSCRATCANLSSFRCLPVAEQRLLGTDQAGDQIANKFVCFLFHVGDS